MALLPCHCVLLLADYPFRPNIAYSSGGAGRFRTKDAEQWQAGGKEVPVGATIVAVCPTSFASAATAQRITVAGLTLWVNRQAFPDKGNGFWGSSHSGQIFGANVTKKPFIQAVEVTGVNIAIPLYHKLMHTMATNATLLRLLTQI